MQARGANVIVGGGVMGAATAFFLARAHRRPVVVVERDPSYRRASSALSASSIRQQFSAPVNIALSRWSFSFLQRAAEWLALPGEPPPALGLHEGGYLYLATTLGANTLRARHAQQAAAGADVVLLDPPALRRRFPWLATEDLALGALGLQGEGWFDGPALHQALRRAAIAHGARFVTGEAVGFETAGDRVTAVRGADGGRWPVDGALVLAAGAWTAALAAPLGVALPVSGRKRDVFVLDSPALPLPGCPLVIDPSGLWFRPEGRGLLAGMPPRDGDPPFAPLDAVDHGLFDAQLWPRLAARVPAFEALRVRSAWAGYYEMNDFDHNGLAGALPGWANAYTACGFSGHGLQQAPAVGCALAAAIAGVRGDGPSIDALSPRRLLDDRPLIEHNII